MRMRRTTLSAALVAATVLAASALVPASAQER